MKTAQVVHNPSAGNAGHTQDEIMDIVEKAGYSADYLSMEDPLEWDNFDPNRTDTIFLVGGDGTVRKLAKVLLEKMKDLPVPIHLMPLGTANNIARTLRISSVLERHAANRKRSVKSFDCGRIKGLTNEEFFLESAGFGVFPELIDEMRKSVNKAGDASIELQKAVQILSEIVKRTKPKKATIKADGITIKGTFLLVELMNIQYLGPNIRLAPHADPGDGYFELLMVPEKNREALEHYLNEMIDGKSENLSLGDFVKTLRVQNVKLRWAGSKMHVDDHLVDDYSGKTIEFEMLTSALSFFQDI